MFKCTSVYFPSKGGRRPKMPLLRTLYPPHSHEAGVAAVGRPGFGQRMEGDIRDRPTQSIAAYCHAAASAEHELVMLRWGLVTSWANDLTIDASIIIDRSETVAEKPSLRTALT